MTIIGIWGVTVAKKIDRINDALTVDQLMLYKAERKIKGLHYLNDGKPVTPRVVWLDENGFATTIVDGLLKTVYQSCGKQYKMSRKFANLTAYYDGKTLSKFHLE